MLSIREIKHFSRLNKITEQNVKDKQFILNELKNVDWYKSIKRIEYNTWLFYKNNNYNIYLDIERKRTRNNYLLIIEDVKIKIRIQDFFFLKFIKKLKKKKLLQDWVIDNYIDINKILIEEPIITNKSSKEYRVDYLLHISNNNYICIEFFENAHKKKDDPDFKLEKNRIYSILHDSDNGNRYKKILFFGIYWESKIEDTICFKKFVNDIYSKIIEYKNIDDERLWCIDGIKKYVDNDILANCLYDAYKNENTPVIDINEINNVIQFKNNQCKVKHFDEFKLNIKELIDSESIDIEDDLVNNICSLDLDSESDSELSKIPNITISEYYENNKLSLKGLTRYLKVKKDFLIDIKEEEKLLNFYTNITKGFIEGLTTMRQSLVNLEQNKIIGLYNF